MTCRLIVRHQAEADIAEAFDWYEVQQAGLGGRFVEAIDRLFQNLQEQPLLYPVRYRSVRWAFSVPFPYKVIYRVEDDSVVVLGVIHAARHSRVWKRRIQ